MHRSYGAAIWALLAAIVAGCGFQPLYGEPTGGAPVAAQLARVRIAEIRAPDPVAQRELSGFRAENNRSAQILRNYLIDDFDIGGAPTSSDYALRIQLIERRTDLAYSRQDTIVRYGYSATAYFNLVDQSGRPVHSGASSSSTTFDASQSNFATLSSEFDARDRLLQEISADIRNQLAAFFFNKAQAASTSD